jgi:hypothetical protein
MTTPSLSLGASAALVGVAFVAMACGGSSSRTPERLSGEVLLWDFGGFTAASAYYGKDASGTCWNEIVGPCRFRRTCADEPDETLDAGAVTVRGVALTNPLSNEALIGAYYVGLPELLQPGDVVDVVATGSTSVPPHGGSVSVPVPIVLTAPAVDVPLTVDASTELVVAWTGGVGSVVEVWLGDGAVGTRVSALCSGSGDSGALVIPPAVLRKLPPTLAVLDVTQANVVNLHEGSWDIGLRAQDHVASLKATLR